MVSKTKIITRSKLRFKMQPHKNWWQVFSFLSPPSVPAHNTPVAATISSNWFTRDVVPAISSRIQEQSVKKQGEMPNVHVWIFKTPPIISNGPIQCSTDFCAHAWRDKNGCRNNGREELEFCFATGKRTVVYNNAGRHIEGKCSSRRRSNESRSDQYPPEKD